MHTFGTARQRTSDSSRNGTALWAQKNPIRMDACLFARLAIKRFQSHRGLELYASTRAEIADFTRDNPRAEVANLILLEGNFAELSRAIGICHFRRTWCNNVVIDYLSVHPNIARPRNDNAVKGAGTALLYFVCQVAVELRAELLWGEATQNSCLFYQRALKLDGTKDLIYATQEQIERFVHRVQKDYGFPRDNV